MLSTHDGAAQLGTDVLTIQDTRPSQASGPADVLHGVGDLKIATYNVENFFTITGEAFADANPSSPTPPAARRAASTTTTALTSRS